MFPICVDSSSWYCCVYGACLMLEGFGWCAGLLSSSTTFWCSWTSKNIWNDCFPHKVKGYIALKVFCIIYIYYIIKCLSFLFCFSQIYIFLDIGGKSESFYWKIIDELEALMNSKVDSVHLRKISHVSPPIFLLPHPFLVLQSF